VLEVTGDRMVVRNDQGVEYGVGQSEALHPIEYGLSLPQFAELAVRVYDSHPSDDHEKALRESVESINYITTQYWRQR
jgi:hypothetical protein